MAGLHAFEPPHLVVKKIITLQKHLDFETHPIRKLINAFRDFLMDFIRKKRDDIFESAEFFVMKPSFKKEQMEKLLYGVVTEIKAFVSVMFTAMALFYKLDIRYAEMTNTCLINLITSYILLNPLYSKIYKLIQVTHKEHIAKIDEKIQEINSS